ncbi:MAG: carbohydrate-binding domain-containing protein, partial [Oscillibacter sp.]|nr:carbohydrate-binding domain-containing protein [Oscillibacter sp.]
MGRLFMGRTRSDFRRGAPVQLLSAAAILVVCLCLLIALDWSPAERGGWNTVSSDANFYLYDLDDQWWRSYPLVAIHLSDAGIPDTSSSYFYNGELRILQGGRYRLTGELKNGCVTVDAGPEGRIWLLLDGVRIHRNGGAAIRVKSAEKVIITLADGSENRLSGGGEPILETETASRGEVVRL